MSLTCWVFSSISAVSSAIFCLSAVIWSLNSSMARERRMASRVSEARSASHCSFFARSTFSSFCSTSSILSTAAMTSSKCPALAAATRACSTRMRASPAAAAWRSASAAPAERRASEAEEAVCRKEAAAALLSWEAKDCLKRSLASSLCKIATALEMAESSPTRSSLRSFHSTVFSSLAFCTCSMYLLSFSICVVNASSSSADSSLERPRAPVSFSIFFSASCEEVNSAFFDSMSLS
mmetsp:Transcript_105152/g.302344  ORF Transcript_105152/g.302344 Transcript_105152/m.302344 type:complete len:237 (+) Transcript_105152:801-1511(+)